MSACLLILGASVLTPTPRARSQLRKPDLHSILMDWLALECSQLPYSFTEPMFCLHIACSSCDIVVGLCSRREKDRLQIVGKTEPNFCHHSMQNLLSSSFLSKTSKINKIYRTIILPVVSYGYETWSLTLREELRLRVFENRVLRRISGSKRDEVTGEWRKLQGGA